MNLSTSFGPRAAMAAALFLGLTIMIPDASAYIPGDEKGKAEFDCFVGLEGYAPGDQTPFGKKGKPAIQCTDCDPACDLDGEATPNGTCTFSIAVAVNQSGVTGCTPAPLKKVVAKAKTKGTKLLSKKGDFGTLPIDGSSAVGSFADFPVLVKKFGKPKAKAGKGKLIVLGKKPKDKDKFTFICNPRPEGEECPSTSGCHAPEAGEPTKVLFTNSLGTLSCGGAKRVVDQGVWTDGDPPYSGQLLDENDAVLGNLGLGCLFLGGGAAFNVPPGANPENATNTFAVSEICSDGTIELAPDVGTGPKDCTIGPLSTSSCIHTLPATQICTQDSDCVGGGTGSCAQDPSCFFGTPLPIANAGLSTCVINVILDGVGGTIDPAVGDASIQMPLQSRVYLTGNGTAPCPTCSSDVCDPTWMTGSPLTPSPNAGDACTTTATSLVTHDCLPAGFFVGRIPVDLTPLTTGSTMLESTDGMFCPGQVATIGPGLNGAFGLLAARKIVEVGEPFGDLSGGSGTGILASTFCIPKTGNGLIDGSADLPGPGATSLPGLLELVSAP